MKNRMILGVSLLALVSCGPSAEDVKQKTIDISVANVCDCFEANQNDWLAYQKCKSRIETGRILLEDNPEGLADFESQVAQCDKYHKD